MSRVRRWARSPTALDVRAAVPAWVVARLVVAVGAVVAIAAANELAPGGRPIQLRQGLFAWDAAFYRDIAELGYDGVAREGLRFFPLVPLAARALGTVVRSDGLALVLVANAAALVAGALLHRLAMQELGDRDVARRAAWLLALLPPAAVLVLGYAESTLLALSIATFLALRRRRWLAAALLGALAAFCRPVGAVLALPAAIEAARGLRRARGADRARRLAAVVGPLGGTGAYLAWVAAEYGDWRLPIRLQAVGELRGDAANPLTRALDAVEGLFGGERLGDGLHAPWIVLFTVLLVVAFRRLPASYGAYAAVLLVVALAAESLGSFERYGLAAFPLVLAGATLLGRPPLERAALVASGAGLAGFTTLILLGVFVP